MAAILGPLFKDVLRVGTEETHRRDTAVFVRVHPIGLDGHLLRQDIDGVQPTGVHEAQSRQ